MHVNIHVANRHSLHRNCHTKLCKTQLVIARMFAAQQDESHAGAPNASCLASREASSLVVCKLRSSGGPSKIYGKRFISKSAGKTQMPDRLKMS